MAGTLTLLLLSFTWPSLSSVGSAAAFDIDASRLTTVLGQLYTLVCVCCTFCCRIRRSPWRPATQPVMASGLQASAKWRMFWRLAPRLFARWDASGRLGALYAATKTATKHVRAVRAACAEEPNGSQTQTDADA